jgi:hypothetical protein
MTRKDADAIRAELAQFICSATLYRHRLGLHSTEGVRHLAERCAAFWLIELIGCFLPDVRRDRKCRDFWVWRLRVRPGCEADLTCDDGDGRVIARQHLSFTDFPLPAAAPSCARGTPAAPPPLPLPLPRFSRSLEGSTHPPPTQATPVVRRNRTASRA